MKQIKMTDGQKNELLCVYKNFSDEQLYEIFLGEKEGIDFNSYARNELTAQQMKDAREALLLDKCKNTARFECKYFTSNARELSGFYNASELLLKYLFNEEIPGVSYRDIRRWAGVEGVLQGKLNKIVEHLEGGRTLVNGYDSDLPVLPEAYCQVAKAFRFEKAEECLWFYPSVNERADVYKTFGKNGQSKEKNVVLNSDTAFALRDLIPGYNESYYSVGFTCQAYAFSLAVLPNNTATKSAARVELVFCDESTIYVDDANKYFDTSLLTCGLKS